VARALPSHGTGFDLPVTLWNDAFRPFPKASLGHFGGRTTPLNSVNSPSPARASISEDESVRRQREVDFARGSIRYEGGILSGEIERLNASYVAGEISSNELTAAILAFDTVRQPSP
jgi:hypothetical protein